MAGTKRGAHLALSLERLEPSSRPAGSRAPAHRAVCHAAPARAHRRLPRRGRPRGRDHRCRARKALELEVIVPVEDMARMGEALDSTRSPAGRRRPEARRCIWPSIHPRLLELIRAHRSTLIFVNSRRLAERLAARLNELAGEELVRAHHGSIAREQRLEIEEALKDGRLPALVATSSLELGIDMGASTSSCRSRRRHRCGRAAADRARRAPGGGADRRARSSPSTAATCSRRRSSCDACAAGRSRRRASRATPLDVLAQQLVAMLLHGRVDGRRAARAWSTPRRELPRAVARAARRRARHALRPLPVRRVRRAQAADRLGPRRPARSRAATTRAWWRSPQAAPSRTAGLRRLPAGRDGKGGRRVGELDEEMVYESRAWARRSCSARARPGGSRRSRRDRVHRHAGARRAGQDAVLARRRRRPPDRARPGHRRDSCASWRRCRAAAAETRLRDEHGSTRWRRATCIQYLADQREATGALPTDRTLVIERFRDELGDWRVCLLSPFGGRVHAPWAMAIEARLRERRPRGPDDLDRRRHRVRLPEADDAARVEELLLLDPGRDRGAC